MDIDCSGCLHDIPGDCAARSLGSDGYLHFPAGGCHTGRCGKLNDGMPCRMPKGSSCPDCGVGLHDFGGQD